MELLRRRLLNHATAMLGPLMKRVAGILETSDLLDETFPAQGLRRIDGRRGEGFAIDQAMQQVQHMRLGRDTGLQSVSTADSTAFSSC